MKVLFDNVMKDAKHIYDWGNLELEDRQRLKGIIEVLNACKEKIERYETALKEIQEKGKWSITVEECSDIAEEALKE